jgi:hypothetical protein
MLGIGINWLVTVEKPGILTGAMTTNGSLTIFTASFVILTAVFGSYAVFGKNIFLLVLVSHLLSDSTRHLTQFFTVWSCFVFDVSGAFLLRNLYFRRCSKNRRRIVQICRDNR